MDCAPLNLAHFHERRAEKLLKRHDFDEAYKAIETSLYYLQDAYKNARISKSLEVLNTQKWDYERKLHQISMRKQQYERIKVKEIVPSPIENNLSGKSTEVTIVNNAQMIARSIDKTIKDFESMHRVQLQSHDHHSSQLYLNGGVVDKDKNVDYKDNKRNSCLFEEHSQKEDDMPSLAPLELPSFDYSGFLTSGLMDKLYKRPDKV